MKYLFFVFSFIFAATLTVSAQSRTDTVVVGTDTIVKPISAILVQPSVVNAAGDTAYSMDFIALNVSSDTLSGCNSYVTLMNKKGGVVAGFNQELPAAVLNLWGKSPKPIFDYILEQNPRFRRVARRLVTQ
jgi:hypothetical protein